MSSDERVARSSAASAGLAPGEQVLATVSSMDRPFDVVPQSAFETLLVVSSKSPARIARGLAERGVDPSTVGMIPVADGSVEPDAALRTTRPVAPDDLTGLSMAYTRATEFLPPGEGWVFVDVIDVLVCFTETDRVVRFLNHVANHARERELRGIYTVVPSALNDETFGTVRRLFDRELDSR